ncbi:MAG: Ppx/GppA family phosphatase [Caulobacteraceae bacterium]|nr:Ppx/GppA family phosphatase [Caulobacteraceae bacterium]
MDEATSALEFPRGLMTLSPRAPVFAALDLGTNNCRLLIAKPSLRGFRIVDAYSRIVRLGEGVSHTGRLAESAMNRAIEALQVCAERIERRGVSCFRAVATQACRVAANGPEFLERVAERTGLQLQMISPREEAELAVIGCMDLLDRKAEAGLVLDVGGGSTELSWLDMRAPGLSEYASGRERGPPPIAAWYSAPIGVVTLAERFPEAPGDPAWRRAMIEAFKVELAKFEGADGLRDLFESGRGHIVGTSGAITSLAGVHLDLKRYERRRVDGLWMTREACEGAADRLAALSVEARAVQPCIGPDRADLVLAGAAILQAVQELWPAARVRVADRGLREGLLLSLLASHRTRRQRGTAS